VQPLRKGLNRCRVPQTIAEKVPALRTDCCEYCSVNKPSNQLYYEENAEHPVWSIAAQARGEARRYIAWHERCLDSITRRHSHSGRSSSHSKLSVDIKKDRIEHCTRQTEQNPCHQRSAWAWAWACSHANTQDLCTSNVSRPERLRRGCVPSVDKAWHSTVDKAVRTLPTSSLWSLATTWVNSIGKCVNANLVLNGCRDWTGSQPDETNAGMTEIVPARTDPPIEPRTIAPNVVGRNALWVSKNKRKTRNQVAILRARIPPETKGSVGKHPLETATPYDYADCSNPTARCVTGT